MTVLLECLSAVGTDAVRCRPRLPARCHLLQTRCRRREYCYCLRVQAPRWCRSRWSGRDCRAGRIPAVRRAVRRIQRRTSCRHKTAAATPSFGRCPGAEHDAALASDKHTPFAVTGNGVEMELIGIVQFAVLVDPVLSAVLGGNQSAEGAHCPASIDVLEPHIHKGRGKYRFLQGQIRILQVDTRVFEINFKLHLRCPRPPSPGAVPVPPRWR